MDKVMPKHFLKSFSLKRLFSAIAQSSEAFHSLDPIELMLLQDTGL